MDSTGDGNRVGVLVVHGIGNRSPSRSLETVANALHRGLEDWMGSAGATVELEAAHLPAAADGRAAEAVIVVREPSGTAVHLLLREAWWGGEVSVPTFRTMVTWAGTLAQLSVAQMLTPLVRALLVVFSGARAVVREGVPMTIAALGFAGHRAIVEEDRELSARTDDDLRAAWRLQRTIPRRERTVLPFNAPAVAALVAIGPHLVKGAAAAIRWSAFPITVLAMLVVWVAGPLPRVGKPARRVQDALRTSVGDSYVWQRDALGRAAILSSVGRGLDELRTESDHIAVLAHSQGAAIVHQLLAGRPETAGTVDLLVTYGQGIRRLGPDVVPGLTPTVTSWWDISATRDPVSVEPLPDVDGRRGSRARVRRSVTRDHSAYWGDDEEVTLPVALRLLALGGRPTTEAETAVLAQVARARHRRVDALTAARAAIVVTAVAIAAAARPTWLADLTRRGVDLVEWAADRLPLVDVTVADRITEGRLSTVVGGAAVIALGVGWAYAAASPWSAWDTSTRGRVRRRDPSHRVSPAGIGVAALAAAPSAVAATTTVFVDDGWVRSGDARWGLLATVGLAIALVAWLIVAAALRTDATERRSQARAQRRGGRRAAAEERIRAAYRDGLGQLDELDDVERAKAVAAAASGPSGLAGTLAALGLR